MFLMHNCFLIAQLLAQYDGDWAEAPRSSRDLMELAVFVFIIALPILLGLIVGRAVERRHFRLLAEREAAIRGMVISDVRSFPQADPTKPGGEMVTGEAVITDDPLKGFLSKLRRIVGGEIRSYTSLVERARREASLRVLEEAQRRGFNAVCNLRLQTSDITGNAQNSGRRQYTTAIAVLASGTAYSARTG